MESAELPSTSFLNINLTTSLMYELVLSSNPIPARTFPRTWPRYVETAHGEVCLFNKSPLLSLTR